MKNIKKILVTFFGLGFIPRAPGTFGTLGAAAVYLALAFFDVNAIVLFVLWVLTTALCIILAPWAKEHFHSDDPKQFVLDEVAGFFFTMIFIPFQRFWLATALGFVLFRFFDILKPFPIKRAERLPQNIAVVADDIVAGLYANIFLRVTLSLIPG